MKRTSAQWYLIAIIAGFVIAKFIFRALADEFELPIIIAVCSYIITDHADERLKKDKTEQP